MWASVTFLNLADRLGERGLPLQAMGNSIMAIIGGAILGAKIGDAYARQVRRQQKICDQEERLGEPDFLLGMYALGMGRMPRADRLLQSSMDISTRIGFIRLWEEAASLKGLCLFWQGKYEPARRLADELGRQAHKAMDRQSLGTACLIKAMAALRVGQGAEALPILDFSSETGPMVADESARALHQALIVQANWVVGNRREAVVDIQRILTDLSKPLMPTFTPLVPLAGLAALILDDHDSGAGTLPLPLAHQALALMRRITSSYPVGAAMCLLVEGRLRLLQGRLNQARSCLERARQVAERAGMPFEAEQAARLLQQVTTGVSMN